MVSWGNSTEIQKFVDVLYNYQMSADDRAYGRPHISDMIIGQKRQEVFAAAPSSAPVFHYSTYFSSHHHVMPKARNINQHLRLFFGNTHWVYHLAQFIGTHEALVGTIIEQVTSCKSRSPYCRDHYSTPLCSFLVPQGNYQDYVTKCHFSTIETLGHAMHFGPSVNTSDPQQISLKTLVLLFAEHPIDRIALEYERDKDKLGSFDNFLSTRNHNSLLRSIVPIEEQVTEEEAFYKAKERIERYENLPLT